MKRRTLFGMVGAAAAGVALAPGGGKTEAAPAEDGYLTFTTVPTPEPLVTTRFERDVNTLHVTGGSTFVGDVVITGNLRVLDSGGNEMLTTATTANMLSDARAEGYNRGHDVASAAAESRMTIRSADPATYGSLTLGTSGTLMAISTVPIHSQQYRHGWVDIDLT